MRRVLFVAYHFPPVGGAGVQRSVQFARHLPAFGYEPVVLTGPGEEYGSWTPLDDSLGGAVPADVEIVRVPGPVPADSSLRRSRVERWARLASPFERWWGDGILRTGASVSGVELVYVSLSPYESAMPALAIARRLGVPCVLDLRDPWALDEMLTYPTGAHRRLELARMTRALDTADAVVANCAEAARRLAERRPALAPRLAVIPNGFDPRDFAGASPPPARDGFRIVHTGFLHTQFGTDRRRGASLRRRLGGAAAADPLTRSHVFLLRALSRLRELEPGIGDAVELHLAGALSPGDRGIDRDGIVREHGYLPHAESVALMRSADLLFLPLHDLPAGERATIVPGKTYEYLGSGRPLLAAVPDGDARDLLEPLPWAHLCRPADAEGMARVVAGLALRKRERGPEPDGDRALVATYERRELTARLAGVFDGALDAPAVPELSAAAA